MQKVVLAVLLFIATSGQAEIFCRDYGSLRSLLQSTQGQQLTGSGYAIHDNVVVEVWVDAFNDDWSLVSRRPNGSGCIVARGSGWTPRAPLRIVILQKEERVDPVEDLQQRYELRRALGNQPPIVVRRAGRVEPPHRGFLVPPDDDQL